MIWRFRPGQSQVCEYLHGNTTSHGQILLLPCPGPDRESKIGNERRSDEAQTR